MRLLMVSGDRQVSVGERGPFHAMQAEFSRYFERIDVLCPRPDRPPTVHTIHDNVHLHPADCGRRRMVGYIRRRGAELIAEHGHALIVSHDYGWFYNGLGSARLSRRTGIPYLSEIHHVPGHPVAADLREVLDRVVARRYVRWARTRARAFRVVNAVEMPALLERWGVPREQVLVLHSLYIDLDTFRPPETPVAPEQDVVFVGRMVNNKGLDRIVDALALLAERDRPTTALFLGRGPLREATERRVRRHGLGERVRFVDWVDTPADLADVYRKSRVCVCASTCEGGPRVTVEAMASGTPAVSTPVGIMAEVLRDGENGARAGFDTRSLADALERVLADEERRVAMGVEARRVAERFEYARVLRRYAQGLGRLVGEELVRA
jgi:glycosyltransferase involved in cell wall biosynthesis